MAEVFILLGGNVGDKSKILGHARKLIGERIGFITKMSAVYSTESWGFESPLFFNQVIVVETALNPIDLLGQTQLIETDMGRIKKSTHYEARIIDIDLLFYDNLHIETPELTIPHPRIAMRKFVLIPLNEIAPDKLHPVSGMKMAELLHHCQDPLKVDRND